MISEAREPFARASVMLGPDKLGREPRAGFQPVERSRRDGDSGAVEKEPVNFGDDEVRGQER